MQSTWIVRGRVAVPVGGLNPSHANVLNAISMHRLLPTSVRAGDEARSLCCAVFDKKRCKNL